MTILNSNYLASTIVTLFGIGIGPLMAASVATADVAPTPAPASPAVGLPYPSGHPLPLIFNNSNGGFDGEGRPPSRTSGGSRGDCRNLLIALVPGEGTLADGNDCSQPSLAFTASTTTSTPTLWFYIPEHSQNAQIELALLDDDQRAIAIRTLPAPSSAGIVGVPLNYELQENQSYRWVFSLIEDASPTRILTVEGTVRRVVLDPGQLQQLGQTSTQRDRIVLLAQTGIWHDALTELVALRQQQPQGNTAVEDWQQFLGSVGLGAIADAPIID